MLEAIEVLLSSWKEQKRKRETCRTKYGTSEERWLWPLASDLARKTENKADLPEW